MIHKTTDKIYSDSFVCPNNSEKDDFKVQLIRVGQLNIHLKVARPGLTSRSQAGVEIWGGGR